MRETESLSNNRAKAVGSDNEPARQTARLSARLDDSYTAHSARLVLGDVRHARQLLDPGAGSSRAVEHDRVENCSTRREAIVTKWSKSVGRCKLAIGVFPVRRTHPHPGEVCRGCALDLVEDIHVGKDPRRLWAQILRADLVARKLRSV